MYFPISAAGFFAKSQIMFFLLSLFRFCPPLKNDGTSSFCFPMIFSLCMNACLHRLSVTAFLFFMFCSYLYSLFAIKKRTLRVRLFFYFLEEQSKEAGTYDGHDAGYADGKGTHRAFYGPYFHGSCRAHPVGSRAEGNPFGYRVGDM